MTTPSFHRELIEIDRYTLWHPFTQMQDWMSEDPLVIEKGEGVYLWDTLGRRYYDGYSSLWVNIHGHQKKEINQAIENQLNRISHSTFLGLSNIPAIQLAQRLTQIAPKDLSRVFYSDNGSTALEIGVKMAFQYWQHQGGALTKKVKYVSFVNAYHGDTIGTMSLGGIPLFQDLFKSLYYPTYKIESPTCYRCPLSLEFPDCHLACAESLEKILKEHHAEIAAIVMEPGVQAAGGMVVLPSGYLQKVRALATEFQVLLILDEVATGFGRTGRMFACEIEGVNPDILAVAKGMTGGYLPLAATLTTEKIYEAFLGKYEAFKTFFHGHSYTGNQLGCAAALANLEIFEKEETLNTLQEKISLMKDRLSTFDEILPVGNVRQIGLIGIIELVKDRKNKHPFPLEEKRGIQVCQEARKRGLLIRPLGNVLALMPPLCSTAEELTEMILILRESILACDWSSCNPG
ncbi:MAG: adenosylmethionine--8-amino-7-oxononanoate transaminase [Nitrospirae bacterium]|nr:adenosylmethionine--8-amino-7-oxononanoate transaminase [Nitrospirota bacterium]